MLDHSSSLRFFEEDECIEKAVIETIIYSFNERDTTHLVFLFSHRLYIVISESSLRNIIYTWFRSKRWDLLHTKKVDPVIYTHHFLQGFSDSLISPPSMFHIHPFLFEGITPFLHRVSFCDDLHFHSYPPGDIRGSYDVVKNRIESKKLLEIFGKDTTSIYRWDYTPSYDFLEDFLREKTNDI